MNVRGTFRSDRTGARRGRRIESCHLFPTSKRANFLNPLGIQKAVSNAYCFEGKLNSYLYEINSQAEEMFDNLIVQYKKSEGVTEELKATNQMEWVRRMNNIKQRVTEIVNNELIYK